jgi:excisionase family DNA binding protein
MSDSRAQLMTTDEVCAYLQCSRDWLYIQIEKKRIPFIRIGERLYRFRPEEIEAWLAEHSAAENKER